MGADLAAVLVAGGFAFMHSTLQTWATEVVPEARATVISLFAGALFAGSGVATVAAAPHTSPQTPGSVGLLVIRGMRRSNPGPVNAENAVKR